MWKNLAVAAAAAGVVGVVTASCGSSNLCADRNVRCEAPLTCDPGDGVCKCGGRGGVNCPDGFACDPLANTCLSTRCAHVDCSSRPGTSCDVIDGLCRCGGTGGLLCADDESCNPVARACMAQLNCASVACPRNMSCDQQSGRCRCGGAECAGGQACSLSGTNVKTCVADACSGVTCSGNTVCDAADGYCKCNGTMCQSGESCACPQGADGGCAQTDRSCRAGSACSLVTCPDNNTLCDPTDGQCRCGGPGGPACASSQLCALGPPKQCQGGQQCQLPDGGPKACGGGTSCDPEDGLCKCGGRGGVACTPAGGWDGGTGERAEVCVQNPSQQACRRPCDTRNPDCPSGQYCYFDSSASTPVAYCAAPTDARGEEAACASPTACFSTTPVPRSIHCNGLALGVPGICRGYCDVVHGTGDCVQTPHAQTCVQIGGAPVGYGFCQPQ